MTKLTVLQCVFIYAIYIFKMTTSVICASNGLTIEIPQGKVKGSYDWSENQRKFLGIPYASVTKRFEESSSPPSWSGTFVADRNIKCSQYFSKLNMPVGQEDCLVVNIFTPITLDDKPLPVMVFIHGGGFYWGSNSDLIYNPRYLVKEKVIVVTINYRLGAFGFLCLGLNEAPGNIGLKDQIAALKWIKNYIAHFGGNPNSVTLVGESVGSISVNYLLLSDSANELFHRAIMQSGSILTPQAFSYNPVVSASKVALSLGYNTSDPKELLNIFKNSSAEDIVKASHRDQANDVFAPYIFKPCKETETNNKRSLITSTPRELLKKSGLNISVIIGFNNKEGIYWASHYEPLTLKKLKEKFDTIIPNYLIFEKDDDKRTFMADVLKMYFKNTTVTNGLINFFTDSVIAYPSLVTSTTFRQNPDWTMHNYYFKYDSTRNLNKFLTRLPTVSGACHGDELFYLFDPIIYYVIPSTAKDLAMIQTMTKLWTSFANTGEPTSENTEWKASKQQLTFLEINTATKMTTLPNESRMEFWTRAFEKYGRQ